MIKYIKKWWHNKFIGDSKVYPKYSCADFLFVFIKNCKTDMQRIDFILDCMVSSDKTSRREIHNVIRDHYPQYKKVLDEPGKYRVLM